MSHNLHTYIAQNISNTAKGYSKGTTNNLYHWKSNEFLLFNDIKPIRHNRQAHLKKLQTLDEGILNLMLDLYIYIQHNNNNNCFS